MRAAVLREGATELTVEELSQEPPRAGEVQLRIDAAGICASDHHVMEGTAVLPRPCVLGHEGAGTVEAVGPGVTSVSVGQRCVLSFVSNCGHCRSCRSGSPQLCEENLRTGVRQFDGTTRLTDASGAEVFQMSKLGVFSERVVAPAQSCYPIPDDVPMDVAALIGCCVTTGFGSAANTPEVRPGATVAVIGLGGVGLNVVQGARLAGASRIIGVDLSEEKLAFAARFGVSDRVDATTSDPVTAIRELTDGGVDVAFDAFGSAETTRQALEALRPSGVAVLVGLAPLGDRSSLDLVDIVRREKTLRGAYYGAASPHETFNTVIDLYRSGKLLVDELVQRRYELTEINEGFAALARGELGRGVVVF